MPCTDLTECKHCGSTQFKKDRCSICHEWVN